MATQNTGIRGNQKNKRKKNDEEETETEPAAQQQPSKKKSRKEIAIFGNYRNYYGYRVILSSFSDFPLFSIPVISMLILRKKKEEDFICLLM